MAIAVTNLVGDGSPAIVSETDGNTTVSVTGVNITTGSALIISYEAQGDGGTASVPTVSGGGGTSSTIISVTGSPSRRVGCVKYIGATGSGVTITLTFSGNVHAASVGIDEVTGANNAANWTTNAGSGSGTGPGSGRPVLSISTTLSAHGAGSATYGFGTIDDTAGSAAATGESGDWTVTVSGARGSFSTRLGAAFNLLGDTTPTLTMGQNASTDPWFFVAFEIPADGATSTTKTPQTAVMTFEGRVPTHNAFNFVRIRDVLINESGQAVGGQTNIRLLVWYSGQCVGAPDISLNAMTTDTNGTASWSIPTGSLVNGQPIFYVAQDSLSFSNYTCARMTPSYE